MLVLIHMVSINHIHKYKQNNYNQIFSKKNYKFTLIEHHFSTLLFAVSKILAISSTLKPLSLKAMARFFTSLGYDLRCAEPLLCFLRSNLWSSVSEANLILPSSSSSSSSYSSLSFDILD